MKQFTILLLFTWILISNSKAQPGSVDSSFGVNGLSVTGDAELKKMIILNDDKILVLNPYNSLMRYLPDGILDPTFGTNGRLDISAGTGIFNGSKDFAFAPDGKLVVAGFDFINDTFVIALHRFGADGTPDLTFGNNSSVITNLGGHNQGAEGVAIQADGKIVVTGPYAINENSSSHPFVARYNEDGSLDNSFASGGKIILTSFAYTPCIAIQNNGKIILAGGTPFLGNPNDIFFLACITPTGQMDKTFGANGIVTTNFDLGRDYINQIALQADGKIIAAGAAREIGSTDLDSIPYMAVARYNAEGSLDGSFGTGGKAKIIFDYLSQANAVELQKNGKIVVAGVWSHNNGSFAIARLSPNGTPDSSFGTDGKTQTDIGTVGDQIFDIGIQQNGHIVAGGQQLFNTIAMVRYLGDPTHPLYTKIKRWIRKHILNFEDTNPNAAYYVIEKSTTAAGAYMPVTKINATTVNAVHSYPLAANIQAAGATDYYRIKTVNKDNSVTYTDAITDDASITQQINKSTNQQIHIYPNPAKNSITIQAATAVTVRLQNSNGLVLRTQKINGSGSMDISKLHSGIYYVVNTETGESYKLVKE